jgi:hypothetical protein
MRGFDVVLFLLPVRGRGCCGALCISPLRSSLVTVVPILSMGVPRKLTRVYLLDKFTNPIQIPKRMSQGLNLEIPEKGETKRRPKRKRVIPMTLHVSIKTWTFAELNVDNLLVDFDWHLPLIGGRKTHRAFVSFSPPSGYLRPRAG